ncbi:MAG: SDR family NAD(P)-dependent oxidoreductase [Sedimentisphaerales bacterium]
MKEHKMKMVLVTGTAGGIRKAICDVFYQADYRVIGVDRRATENLPYEVLDYDISRLAHADTARELFYRRVEELCQGRMDALVNNAAIQIVKPMHDPVVAR